METAMNPAKELTTTLQTVQKTVDQSTESPVRVVQEPAEYLGPEEETLPQVTEAYEEQTPPKRKNFPVIELPWHQDAFLTYLAMGPSERTIPKVADIYGKHKGYIQRVSQAFHWKERAQRWDRRDPVVAEKLPIILEMRKKQIDTLAVVVRILHKRGSALDKKESELLTEKDLSFLNSLPRLEKEIAEARNKVNEWPYGNLEDETEAGNGKGVGHTTNAAQINQFFVCEKR